LVLIRVLDSPRPQSFRALVERIYSARRGIDSACLGKEIEFVGAGGAWGQETLVVGDRALLFVRSTRGSGRLYEDSWKGHMVVEEIDGKAYAIIQFPTLWVHEDLPALVRKYSREAPGRPYWTAIRLDVLEGYLIDLNEKV
jgi:hypothetical protein